MAPNMAKPTTKPMALAAANTLLAKRGSGINGSTARLSAHRNRSPNTTPATARPIMKGDVHSYDCLLYTSTAAYEKAVAKAGTGANGALTVPPGAYGPVGPIISSLTSMARSGALDGALLTSRQFYGTDYTKPLLFIADGTYLANLAQDQHLSGDQWGMMNETGNFPGQAWLWLYTLWYQVPPMNTSSSGRCV